jgi:uncharacterized delta-60 repeat protein
VIGLIEVYSLTLQPDGKILVTGYAGSAPIARFNPDGSTDPAFKPDLVIGTSRIGTIAATALQADGTILVAAGQLLRLRADGSLDTSFKIDNTYRQVSTIAIQPTGEIIIGGEFCATFCTGRYYLERLYGDGRTVEDLGFRPIVRLPSGIVHLSLLGQRAKDYLLQASDDLQRWTTLLTNSNPRIPVGFVDTNAIHSSERFYRVKPTPQ